MSNNKDIKENEEMSLKELILKIKYWLQFILLKWKIFKLCVCWTCLYIGDAKSLKHKNFKVRTLKKI